MRMIDPDNWVSIDEETLLDGVFGMEQGYFIEYVIKQKGSTALVDENSIIIKSRPKPLAGFSKLADRPGYKGNYFRQHYVKVYSCLMFIRRKRYDNVKGVRLDDATLTQVQQVARQNNQTFSEYVRELIKKALTEV